MTLGCPGPALHLRASKCRPSSPRLRQQKDQGWNTLGGGVGAVRGAFEVSDLVSPACHQQGHTAGPQHWPRLRLAPCLGPGVVSGALYGEGALRGLGSGHPWVPALDPPCSTSLSQAGAEVLSQEKGGPAARGLRPADAPTPCSVGSSPTHRPGHWQGTPDSPDGARCSATTAPGNLGLQAGPAHARLRDLSQSHVPPRRSAP